MKLARITLNVATLGLAGYGAHQIWVRYHGPAVALTHDTSEAVEHQIAPAIHDGAKSVGEASRAAASHVADVAREAVTSVTESAHGIPVTSPAVDDTGLVPSDRGKA
jgi:hypothetical protein